MQPVLISILLTLTLLWTLSHNIKKSKSPNKAIVKSYPAREDAANSVRKQDISDLPYIKVPLDSFPFDITLKNKKKQLQILEYEKEIRLLSEKQMLNLIGITNTQLKESYGPANLETLSICDQNYSRYIRTLYLFAECIFEEYPEKAVSILEYCIDIGTDISGTYDLLGQYYAIHEEKEKLYALYSKIPEPNSISGKVIRTKLDHISML